MAPGVWRTWPATPSLPLPPTPAGQLTAVPAPTFDFHAGLTCDSHVVKMLLVPLPSERCTGRMAVAGSVTPALTRAIAGSFQVFTVPRKIPATASGVSASD